MNVLLLGADGQVGGLLRQTLSTGVDQVRFVTRHGRTGDLACDLGIADDVRALLKWTRPDLVVNAAAYTAVDQAETDARLAMRINADLPRIIGETLAAWDGKVVHFSTDYVFDGQASRPYLETDEPSPLGVYGRSKLAGEQALAGTGVRHLILRSAWVYDTRGRNFLTTMLRLAREHQELKVVNDQYGSPTSARLLANVTPTVVTRWVHSPQSREMDGIYHLTTTGTTTWWQFAKAVIEDAWALRMLPSLVPVAPITTGEFPTIAARPPYSALSCGKIAATFAIDLPDWRHELRRVFATTLPLPEPGSSD